MSTMQRAWLAVCVTAVLVTTSVGWARWARASLGPYALAALSWRCRHRQIPWAALLGASVRVILHHDGLTWGSRVLGDPDHKRSTSAHPLAPLAQRRDQESGGYLWGPSLLFRLVVTPTLTCPVGVSFYPPAPELSAWDKTETALKQHGVPAQERPPQPPPTPH